MISVTFSYLTGFKSTLFRNARLTGSWAGWSELPMDDMTADDGCPAFTRTVTFDDSLAGQPIRWGVRLDGPDGPDIWGISAEVNSSDSQERYREFTLPGPGESVQQHYYLTWSRRLGAQKVYSGAPTPALVFRTWAPNARSVEVVLARSDRPYIADDGTGVDPATPPISLQPGPDGIWASGPTGDFAELVGLPYMFRIVNAQGATVHRTDIHSRWQAGRGAIDPARRAWDGEPSSLDGTVSCSVVIDQDVVREEFEPTTTPPTLVADEEFWRHEFTAESPVPARVEDLIIYELHVGALGYPARGPGTLDDAMRLLDQLSELGVTAIEVMPLAEFSGSFSWGYGDTHLFAIESSSGGRDKYKHFVRECHRRGIAVIQDVVYNPLRGMSRGPRMVTRRQVARAAGTSV